jgi:hypothetical protein
MRKHASSRKKIVPTGTPLSGNSRVSDVPNVKSMDEPGTGHPRMSVFGSMLCTDSGYGEE